MSQKFLNPVEVDGQVSAEYLDLSTTTIHSVNAGEIAWNSVDGTFDIGLLNGVKLQAGQEIHFYGKATEDISNGDAVQFAGVQGDHLLIKKAVASEINANPEYFMGIATQDFSNNQFGYVTAFGNVRELNTTIYNLGEILYYNSESLSVSGLLTNIKPTAPNAKIEVAAVVRVHGTQGILMVRPHVMPKVSDIQDVDINTGTLTQNSGIFWNQLTSRFENKSIVDALGYTPANASGTANYLSKFTGSTTLGNSQIFDNGTNVLIGTTTDGAYAKLVISGGNVLVDNNTNFVTKRADGLVLSMLKVNTSNQLEFNPLYGQGVTGYIFGINGASKMSMNTSGDVTSVSSFRTPTFYDSDNTSYYLNAAGSSNLYDVTANKFVKSGGTSSQFLKADGTVDSNTYLTSVTNISGYSGTLISEDNRIISPSELAANRLKFGFTSWDNNNNSPYADFIHLRSYQDSSGGSDNLVMFKKSGIGMRIWQQTYGSSTAYSTYKDIAFTDGTNATGSWPINVTGTAGSLSNMNISQFTNNSGYITGYTETDTLQSVTNRGATTTLGITAANYNFTTASTGAIGLVTSTSSFRTLSGDGTTYGYGISTNTSGGLDIMANQSGQPIRFWAGTTNVNPIQRMIISAGDVTASDSFRAPIFYDSNNTGYYVDPASTSNFNNINVNGGNGVSIVRSGGGHDPYGTLSVSAPSGDNYAYMGFTRNRILGMAMGIDTSNNYWIGTSGGGYNAIRTGTYMTVSPGGVVTAIGDMRAPVFYDSNNTGYYIDPASTSNLNGLTVASTITGNINGNAVTAGQLQTARTINGTSFNGSANIETSYWGATRTLTIGNTGKTVNGSGNQSWSLAEIGAGAAWYDGWVTNPGYNANTIGGSKSGFTYANNAPYNGPLAHIEAGGYGLQFNAPYSGGTGIGFRTKNGDTGTWNSWYYPAIYGINGGGSLYATVYYDSNDTGYYVDPNGTTVLSYIQANSYIQNLGDLYQRSHIYFLNSAGTGWHNVIDRNGGNPIVNGIDSVRGPIFYDSNNTGYYVNPNGISNFSKILGESVQVLSTSPSLVIQDTDSTGAAQVGYISFRNTSGTETAWTGFGSNANTDFGVINTLGRIYLSATYTEATNSLRAPIFYDSDNTGYYLDPNNTSNLNIVRAANRLTGAWIGVDNTSSASGNGISLYNGASSGQPQYGLMFAGTGTFGTHSAVSGDWATYFTMDTTANRGWIFRNTGVGNVASISNSGILTTEGYMYSASYIQSASAMYSPIYYDGNNSAFYVDPASSSTLQTLNVNASMTLFGGYGSGSGPGLAFENQSTFARMAFFGLDFYEWDYGNVGGINNGYIYSNTSLRAPIFYDSNNTSYYLNPADFSYVNSLEAVTYLASANFYARSNTHVRNTADTAWNIVIQRNSGNNWIVYGGDSMRAPIFYDSNNTTYYFDGASTGDSIRCAGDIVAYYSDERLKDKKGNIENALEKVLALNGFYYEPNKKAQELGYKKKLEVGVSAQEVEAVLPEIIKDAPIGQGYKTLDYGKITPLLIEAIKEQQKQINELKELVNKLITK